MERRALLKLLGGAAATWPMNAWGQQRQRKVRVSILMNLPAAHVEGQRRLTAFTQTLAQLGWIDGTNATFDVHWSEGNVDAYRTQASTIVASAPDVIFASGGNAARAARNATSTTPIIFSQVTDPVGVGLVASLSAPGGNATGFTPWEFGFSGKWFELLKELSPKLSRIAVVRSIANPAPISQFAIIQSLAQSFGIEVIPANPNQDDEVRRVLSTVAGRPGGGLIVVTGLSELNQHLTTLLALAAEHRLPAVYPYRFVAEAGGLASYGPDSREPYRKAAQYADRVLRGEKPADLPVQAAAKFELVINLKTARSLGLTVPPTLLARADEVIE